MDVWYSLVLAKDWSLEHFFQKLPLAGWQKFKNSKKLYFVWCHKNAIFICWVSFAQGGSRGGGRGVNFSNFIPHGRWVGGHPLRHINRYWRSYDLWWCCLNPAPLFACHFNLEVFSIHLKHWNIRNIEISETLNFSDWNTWNTDYILVDFNFKFSRLKVNFQGGCFDQSTLRVNF